ncbi:MAG: AAA family ATPase [Actinomycetota bacterium]|nr:AAA family ATPase [Actinomycetota bacterium]
MRLKQFRVSKFRNIIDSGPIDVEEDVTCLVGMNEAGKTAVLTALNRLNPADDSVFTVQDDYPRWLLIPDRRANVIDETAPIEAYFEIDDSDQQAVDEHFGPGVVEAGNTVTVRQTYGDTAQHWTIPLSSQAAVANALAHAGVTNDLKASLVQADDFPEVLTAIKQQQANLGDPDGEDADHAPELAAALAEAQRVSGGKPVIRIVRQLLQPRLPKFFYFSNYSILQGRIDLSQLDVTTQQRAGSTPEQTARSLLALANTTPDQLAGSDYEDRRAELEAVGNDLTQQVFRYWKQNPNLRVQFDVDRVPQLNPSPGRPAAVHPFLDIRVEDVRHAFTNNFSQRSSGFRWFFSFLAAFTEFETREDNFVVLLDEPGLTLHGRAQANFLDFINERLSVVTQVLYTTHSPFMVETDKMERVRIVEDGGPDTGATVSQEVLRVGQDSLFPLQAALGYDVVQHLFIGDANVLVEGSSDFVYLDAMSRFLANQGRLHLDSDWRIMPAGGANNIPAFVALIGTTMEVTVLIDAGTEGAQRLQRALDAGRMDRQRLITVGDITGSPNSDIEDMFDVEDYLRMYNAAFGKRTTAASLPPGDRVVKRIEQKEGAKYDHYKPAEALLRGQIKMLPQMSVTTLERWSSLFERINASRR